MLKKIVVMTLLAAVTLALTACASSAPNSLSGQKAVYNDKGRIVDYR